MSKEDRKDLADLKLAFEVNEWEDFLLVLNEIRDRDKDIVAMYRKKYLEEKKSIQAYADEVNKHYTKGVEEFALKVVYSKQKDGRHFLEIFAEDGKRKFQEWCKYKDGSFNYR